MGLKHTENPLLDLLHKKQNTLLLQGTEDYLTSFSIGRVFKAVLGTKNAYSEGL